MVIREAVLPIDWPAIRQIRTQVFIVEQACPADEEWDAYEALSTHFLGVEDGVPVATARMRTIEKNPGEYAKLERFSVLKEWRGQKLGSQLVLWVRDWTLARGYNDIRIHAQAHLQRFYERFGFQDAGEPHFQEAGIEHLLMKYHK